MEPGKEKYLNLHSTFYKYNITMQRKLYKVMLETSHKPDKQQKKNEKLEELIL